MLFAPAFPVAALVTYVNNLVRLRADAFLLLRSTQRPRYQGAEDIGSWDSVLSVITFLGVVTNVGIVGITSSHLLRALPMRFLWFHLEKSDRLLVLVLAEHLLLLLVLLFKRGISDVPRDLSVAKAVAAELRRFDLKQRRKLAFEGNPVKGEPPDGGAAATMFSQAVQGIAGLASAPIARSMPAAAPPLTSVPPQPDVSKGMIKKPTLPQPKVPLRWAS